MGTVDEQWTARLLLWGKRACFRRPECKHDLVSYDAITPAAARQILLAFTEDRSVRWLPERITVLHAPRFAMFELPSAGGKIKRVSHLIDVAYVVTARLDAGDTRGDRSAARYALADFEERVRKQRPLQQPFFGLAEFAADYALIECGEQVPSGEAVPSDLGWMLFDTQGAWGSGARFFRPRLVDGSFDVHGEHVLVS
jgi:CRISPR-associated protein Cas5d